MTRWALIVVVAGCGRLHFDALADASADGDAMSAVELCNGIDDTGDGIIDEGCPCTELSIQVAAIAMGDGPGLAWLGDRYVLAGAFTNQGAALRTIDATGVAGAPVTVGSTTAAFSQSGDVVAWSGDELAVVWIDGTTAYFARYDASLSPIGTPLMLDINVGSVHVRWAGDRFVADWGLMTNQSVQLVEISHAGVEISSVLELGAGAATFVYEIAATPTRYLVTYIQMTAVLTAYGILVDRTTLTPGCLKR